MPVHADYNALMTLYNATNGPGWFNNTGWAEGAAGTNCDPCSGWYGVQCNGLGRVTIIDLDGLDNGSAGTAAPGGNNLSGILPDLDFPFLELISLHRNNFAGSSFPNFSSSNLITIGIGHTQLSGTLPDFNFPNLQFLALCCNNFSGPLPAINCPNLRGLYLQDNDFTGQIPSSWGSLTNLYDFIIYNNMLSGCIPAELQNLCPGITNGQIQDNTGLATQSWTDFCNSQAGMCAACTPPAIFPASPLRECFGFFVLFDLTQANPQLIGGVPGLGVNWYRDAAATQPISDPTAFFSSGNDETVYARTYDGICESTSIMPVNLILLPNPFVDPAVDLSSPICTNTILSVSANIQGGTPPYSGDFSIAGQVIPFSNFNGGTFIFPLNISTPGVYDYTVVNFPRVVDANGCNNFTDIILTRTLVVEATPAPFFISSDAPMCAGETRELITSEAGGSFNVIGGPGFIAGNTLFTTGPGTVLLEYSLNINNCVGSATQSIPVNPLPAANAPGFPFERCDEGGGVATFPLTNINGLISGGAGSVSWYEDAVGFQSIANPFAHTSASGTAYAVVSNGQCSSNPVPVSLAVQSPPVLSCAQQNPVSTPGGSNGSATVQISGGTPGYTISWSGAASGSRNQASAGTATITGLIAGNYNVTVTDANGCEQSCAFGITTSGGSASCPSDSLALVALYNATNGPGWTNRTNWLVPGQPISNWYGVSTNAGGCVDTLHLGSNNLTGGLPSELGNLSQLKLLNLSVNNLSGGIPSSLGQLSQLELLNLSLNRLRGSLPSELGQLTQMRQFYCNQNDSLYGPIPATFAQWTLIEILNMSVNYFSGTIPAGVQNWQNLRRCFLNTNQLSGNIPPGFGQLPLLERLNLSLNQLTGSIPAALGDLPAIDSLYLNNNMLSGCIPQELLALCPLLSGASIASNPGLLTQSWGAFCNNSSGACAPTNPDAFITTWKTDNPGTSNNNQITIPGTGTNYLIEWEEVSNPANNGTAVGNNITTVTFPTPGTYRVSISGDFTRIFFNNEGDLQKLLTIEQWGSIAWSSMARAFWGCSNMNCTALDVPNLSGVTTLGAMFADCTLFNGSIGNWNTATVTEMGFMFASASSFNQPIGNWNTSSVTDMRVMFAAASSFNQPIGNWNTSSVADMYGMFRNATAFNQDLSNWDLSSIQTTPLAVGVPRNLFEVFDYSGLDCANYDATLAGWAANPATPNGFSLGATGMQYGSQAARDSLVNLKGWTITGDVYDPACAPTNPDAFITTWKTDNPGTSANNQITIPGTGTNYLIEWQEVGNPANNGSTIGNNITTVTFPTPGTYRVSISGDFMRIRFNNQDDRLKLLMIEQWGDIIWSSMHKAFSGCANMNCIAADAPNLSGVSNMGEMFIGCTSFDGAIGHWNTSSVTNMYALFTNASAFNQPIGNWNTANVTDMALMFDGATAFNQLISGWDVGNVTRMFQMFNNATAFNQPLDGWNTTSVTHMGSMFRNATMFNQPIGSWNTVAVTEMWQMFSNAGSFNQPIQAWNVARVTSMNAMFAGASSFNQNLGSWDLSSVNDVPCSSLTSLCNMFYNSGLDCANYDATLRGWAANPNTPNGLFLGSAGLQYGAQAARDSLVNLKGWTITGDVYDPACAPCPAITASIGGNTAICQGQSATLTFDFNGGTGPYTVAWSNGTLTNINNGHTVSESPTSTTVYSISSATDAGGCPASIGAGATVVVNTLPTASIANTTPANCNQPTGSVTLSVSGTTGTPTYLWSNGAMTQNLSNVAAGNYSVTVTSGNGCTATASATVPGTNAPTVNIANTTPANCNQSTGSVTLSVSGTTGTPTYLWSNGAMTQNLGNVAAGSYSVTVTSGNGCTATTSATVPGTNAPTVSIANTTSANCNQPTGSVTLSVSGATGTPTYLWSNGAMTQNLSNLAAGNYSVTVTSGNGCTATTSASVPGTNSPTVGIANTTPANCNQATGSVTINVSGTTGTPTYNWSNGAMTQNLSNVAAGSYSVTVTSGNGCTATASATVSGTTPPTVSIAGVLPVVCSQPNGAINISVTGAVGTPSYLWSNGATSPNLAGVPIGSYTVTVTSGNGCTAMTSAQVMGTTAASVTVLQVTQPGCNQSNGIVVLSVTNAIGTPAFAWSNGAVTQNLFNIPAGLYTVTVTNGNGCTSTASADLSIAGVPAVAVSSVTPASCGLSNGSVGISVSGVSGTMQYLWSNGANTQNLSNVPAGSYTVTVTNPLNGCGATTSALVGGPMVEPFMFLCQQQTAASMPGTSDGVGAISLSGGTPGYTITWSGGTVTNPNAAVILLANLAAGSYALTATDSGGCSADCTLVIQSATSNSCRASDSLSLRALFAATGGQNWVNKTNWLLAGQPISTWHGITLDAQGCVTHIRLDNNNLTGTLPNLDMSRLQLLSLSGNKLEGTLPALNTPQLRRLNVRNNRLQNIAGLSHITTWNTVVAGTGYPDVIRLDGNIFTFEDLLPDFDILDSWTDYARYAPQDSVFTDTLIVREIGASLTIDLGFDEQVPDNDYNWYKDGQPYQMVSSNKLVFNSLKEEDTGLYYAIVKNSNLDELDLYTRAIMLEVRPDAGGVFNGLTPDDPNGDNCCLVVDQLSEFPDAEMRIYNRWGELVFRQQPYDNRWRGTDLNFSDLPAGTYYYLLTPNREGYKPRRGFILLWR